MCALAAFFVGPDPSAVYHMMPSCQSNADLASAGIMPPLAKL